ncbi:MAG: hypothetical protein KAI66_27500 [Lentisphaeria bacterium]|nr:hypothetical protein [Lentisphaeria bacterium]
MAQAVRGKLIGDTAHLAFEVAWPADSPDDLTGLGWGDVVLWFAGRRHWVSDQEDANDGQGDPVRWTWIDLVEHLARSWAFLRYEENAPFGLVADSPENLRDAHLLKSINGRSEVEVEDAVHAFQHRHDLAAGLKGLWLPPMWMLREGRMMRLRAAEHDLWIPVHETLQVLEDFVGEVLEYSSAKSSARQAYAKKAWQNRQLAKEFVLRLRTHLSKEMLREWTPEGQAPDPWWGDPLSEDGSPLMAAARLSAPLTEDTRQEIVRAISDAEVWRDAAWRATKDVAGSLSLNAGREVL